MRKVFLVLVAVVMIGLFAQNVYPAGSSNITDQMNYTDKDFKKKILTISWVADSSNATIPDLVINATMYGVQGWYLYSAKTDPGSTAPTDNYDIVINVDGFDICGGVLANRDTTNTEMALVVTAAHGFPIVTGDMTVSISGNSVNSATGVIVLTFVAN